MTATRNILTFPSVTIRADRLRHRLSRRHPVRVSHPTSLFVCVIGLALAACPAALILKKIKDLLDQLQATICELPNL